MCMSPFDAISWPVHTDRLALRPAKLDDVDAIWRYYRRDEVGHWITSAPATVEEFRNRFAEATHLSSTIVVELDHDDRDAMVVGDLMLRVQDAWAQAEVADQARDVQAELGWVLDPDHAGHGYATEAVRGLIRVCFEELGLRRVTAECFADNVASRRLMERVGMRQELHAVRDSLRRSGEWVDGMGYALLADEWRGDA